MKRRWVRWWWVLAMVSAVLCGLWSVPGKAVTPADLIQQGQTAYQQGHFDRAIAIWKQAEHAYQTDPDGIAGSRINQAQALMAIGQQRQACKLLAATLYRNGDRLCEFTTDEAPPLQPNPLPAPLATMGVDKLAEALRLLGNLETAELLLRQHWAQAPLSAQSAFLFNLGNTWRDLGTRERDRTEDLDLAAIQPSRCLDPVNTFTAATFYSRAIACYQAATQNNPPTIVQLQANLNYLSLLADLYQWEKHHLPKTKSTELMARFPQVESLIQSTQTQLQSLPLQVERFFIQLNFAHTLTLLRDSQNQPLNTANTIEELLNQAIADAIGWNNQRLKALAIGELGWFYEQTNQLSAALKQTESALKLARSLEVANLHPQDLTYQWEWQRGRILRDLGQTDAAIAAYKHAIQALKSVREQVLGVNPDAQFALRDTSEPIYRELIDLLLPVGQPVSQETLRSVLGYLDALQLAELENFLRCRVPTSQVNSATAIRDRTAAIVYSIILPDRLEVILQTAQQPLQRQTKLIEKNQLNQVIQTILQDTKIRPGDRDGNIISDQQKSSELLYRWLIRDFKPLLEKNSIKTLVFVSDGLLRSIPMAALYDSQTSQYLIDQYAIAVTPGTQILGAKDDQDRSKQALIVGLTTSPPTNITIRHQTFPQFGFLEHVESEVREIQALLPKSEVLVGTDFTPTNFRTQFNQSDYPIVHIASHGSFSSDPRQTFILTDAGQYILVDELQRIVRDRQEIRPEPIELMVLSACQTAKGDRRSTLGFAGAAIRAGANSTLASLWSVNDASTAEMMQAFYQVWTQSPQPISKAEALRQAQLKIREEMPEYQYTYYWAPFVLVGNWR